MTTPSRDHGVADLMQLYAVRELVLCYRPSLGTSLVIDPYRPRLSIDGSDVVLDKSFGRWSITAPTLGGIVYPRGTEDTALLLLQLFDDTAKAPLGSAA